MASAGRPGASQPINMQEAKTHLAAQAMADNLLLASRDLAFRLFPHVALQS